MDGDIHGLLDPYKPVFLKLGSTKPQVFANGCQEFRETTVRIGGRILLAVTNLYVRIKMCVAHSTLIIPPLTASNESLLQSRSCLRL
jgi:hypothetical protein